MKSFDKPLTVGITGGIGSGKTTVCKILEHLGFPVFYSDEVAKKLMNSNAQLIQEITQIFGDQAYIDGKLNRAHLSDQVFKNPKLLEHLNSLVHPAVRSAFQKFVDAHKLSHFVFNEAAILFETGAYLNFDFNILVTADENLRIERVIKRDGVSKMEVQARMANQWPDEKKKPLADYILENSGDALQIKVQEALDFLKVKASLN